MPGTLLCTDGAVDREVCNVRINQTYVSMGYEGIEIIDQVYAGQTGGHAAFTIGDSGGPVYQLSSGNVRAYGMIVAHDASYNQGYYTPVSNITSKMGVSVKLGQGFQQAPAERKPCDQNARFH